MKTKISLRLIVMSILTLFMAVVVSPSMANAQQQGMPVELKFVGNLKDQPLFHLVFDSPEETDYTITVRDAFGNVYYRENVKGSRFVKKFLIKSEDLDEGELQFEVSSKGYSKPVVFEVNNHMQYVQNVVVNKVK